MYPRRPLFARGLAGLRLSMDSFPPRSFLSPIDVVLPNSFMEALRPSHLQSTYGTCEPAGYEPFWRRLRLVSKDMIGHVKG